MGDDRRESVAKEQYGSNDVYLACLSRGITEPGGVSGLAAGTAPACTTTDKEDDAPLQVHRKGAPLRGVSPKGVGGLAVSDVGECLTAVVHGYGGAERALRVIQSPAVLASLADRVRDEDAARHNNGTTDFYRQVLTPDQAIDLDREDVALKASVAGQLVPDKPAPRNKESTDLVAAGDNEVPSVAGNRVDKGHKGSQLATTMAAGGTAAVLDATTVAFEARSTAAAREAVMGVALTALSSARAPQVASLEGAGDAIRVAEDAMFTAIRESAIATGEADRAEAAAKAAAEDALAAVLPRTGEQTSANAVVSAEAAPEGAHSQQDTAPSVDAASDVSVQKLQLPKPSVDAASDVGVQKLQLHKPM